MTVINPFPLNPSWPTEWQGSRLTGRFLDALGNPVVGRIQFKPSASALLATLSRVIVIAATRDVDLDAEGRFEVILPATDDPDINPVSWTYSVVENFPGGRSYNIDAPMNADRDLSQVAPVPSETGTPVQRGKAGVDVVEHGTDGTVARPKDAPLVVWRGTARPVNALPIDQWINL